MLKPVVWPLLLLQSFHLFRMSHFLYTCYHSNQGCGWFFSPINILEAYIFHRARATSANINDADGCSGAYFELDVTLLLSVPDRDFHMWFKWCVQCSDTNKRKINLLYDLLSLLNLPQSPALHIKTDVVIILMKLPELLIIVQQPVWFKSLPCLLSVVQLHSVVLQQHGRSDHGHFLPWKVTAFSCFPLGQALYSTTTWSSVCTVEVQLLVFQSKNGLLLIMNRKDR